VQRKIGPREGRDDVKDQRRSRQLGQDGTG